MIPLPFRAAALALGVALALTPPAFAAEDAKANDDPVVATVNGVKIRHSDVIDAKARLPEQYQALPLDALYPALVSSLIDTKLVATDGRKRQVHRDKAFRARLARIEEQLLERATLARTIEERVTDDAVKARYDQFAKDQSGKSEVHARHILVDSEDKAKAAIDELKKGADFVQLARAQSKDPAAAKGGDLGYFTEEQMVPEFSKAAFAIEKGAYSAAPVQTQFGWHVIKVEDKRPAQVPPLKEVDSELREQLSRDAGLKYIEGLRRDAKIERFNPDGTPAGGAPAPKN